jgi:GNAT superfamily N-acetyltransferase
MKRRFDEAYRERVRLGDGTEVVLRWLRPDDTSLVRAGFEQLSEDSRYLRCLAATPWLTPSTAASLTAVDGENHFAIGAVRERGGREEPAGLAEAIRLSGCADVAEVAIAVVDGLQGRGLGRILLERLLDASRERNIHRLRFEVLSSNGRMRNLLHDVAADRVIHQHGSTFTAEVPLAAADTGG